MREDDHLLQPVASRNSVERDFSSSDVAAVKQEIYAIQTLWQDISAEIIAVAHSRLSHAVVQGELTNDVYLQLMHSLKIEVAKLEDDMNRKVKLIKLQELEAMQRNLLQAYRQRIHTLNPSAPGLDTSLLVPTPQRRTAPAPPTPSNHPSLDQRIQHHPSSIRKRNGSSPLKYLLAGVTIPALTFLGATLGIGVFLIGCALLIVGTFVLRRFRE